MDTKSVEYTTPQPHLYQMIYPTGAIVTYVDIYLEQVNERTD